MLLNNSVVKGYIGYIFEKTLLVACNVTFCHCTISDTRISVSAQAFSGTSYIYPVVLR